MTLPPHTHMYRVRVLSYSDTDQVGDFTMLSGDIVNFSLAIDKRDGTERATGVRLHRLVEEQKDTSQRETVGSLSI